MKIKKLITFLFMVLFSIVHTLSQKNHNDPAKSFREVAICSQCKKNMNECKCFATLNSNSQKGNTPSSSNIAPSYVYKGKRYSKIEYDRAIANDKREEEQRKEKIKEESVVLRSQLKGRNDSSSNPLALKGTRTGNSNKKLELKGNNTKSTYNYKNYHQQSNERPSERDKYQITKTIKEFSQHNNFNKSIDFSEELLSSLLEANLKPEEYPLEAIEKQILHLGIINPIKEFGKEKIKNGVLYNSLLVDIPTESIISDIKKDFISMVSRGVDELELIKINYCDYEKLHERLMIFMEVNEKVTTNIWEYDKKAIKKTIKGTRSVQKNNKEFSEMGRKNINTISEKLKEFLK